MNDPKKPTHARRVSSPRERVGRGATRLRSALAALLPAAALLVPAVADAQTFPADNAWTPLTKDSVPIGDVIGDGQSERDIVGDAMNPAAYVYSDDQYLYFRLRVSATVLAQGGGYKPFGWACLIDTDANLQSYEFIAGVDGIKNPDVVEFYQNTTPALGGNPKDVAETLLATYPPATHAREAPAMSTFGGNPDVFIDWAISKADLAAAGVTDQTPLRIICGTSNNASSLTADLITESGATTLPDLVTDPLTCGPTGCDIPCAGFGEACSVGVGVCAKMGTQVCDPKGGVICDALPGEPSESPETSCDGDDNDCDGMVDEICADQDGDGLTDDQETMLGSNPNDSDTDDDGVPDNEELDPGGDADMDGKPNIADADADGDGLFDGTELGRDCSAPGTDPAAGTCIADADPTTTTDPLDADTDDGGEKDGSEDANHDGKVDAGERDPNVAADDIKGPPPCMSDADCDSSMGSMVCDTTSGTGTCVEGCRGDSADACPEGQACNATGNAIGQCEAVSVEDPNGGFTIEGNGLCAAQPGATSERTLPYFLGLLAGLALLRRRRSGR
jgi:hypothetical protein